MRNDIVCSLGSSVIQHGKKNDRVYLMKLSKDDNHLFIVRKIDALAGEYGYSKSFAKIPGDAREEFIRNGYEVEAIVPGFFSGKIDGYFLSKYYSPEREILKNKEEIDRVIGDTEDIRESGRINDIDKSLTVRKAEEEDIKELSNLYNLVFESYPFPINDPEYLRETMNNHIEYFGIWSGDKLMAASSCETDPDNLNVEMTDFASIPECRGKGFAGILLDAMESAMRKDGYVISYTIARAAFEPINRLFARFGYDYCGTMKNNTNICGSFESMNVWYKKLN